MLNNGKKRKLRDLLSKLSPDLKGELLAKNLEEDVKVVSDKLNNIKDYSGSIEEIQTALNAFQIAVLDKLSSLPDKSELDTIKQSYLASLKDTQEKFSVIVGNLQTDLIASESDGEKSAKELKDLKKSFDDWRIETLRKFSSIGGGAQNQKISVNGTVMSTKYADFNLLGTGGVSITASDDNVKKQTNITIDATGDIPPVTSVSNSDGTLTISPTTGAVVASLALGHANTWTGQQTFGTSAPIFSTMTVGSVLFAGTSGLLSQDNAKFFWDDTNFRLGIGIGTSPQGTIDVKGTLASIITRDLTGSAQNTTFSAIQIGLSGGTSVSAGAGPSFLMFDDNASGTKSFLGRLSAVWENPTAGSEAAGIAFSVRANTGDTNATTLIAQYLSTNTVKLFGQGTTTNPMLQLVDSGNNSTFSVLDNGQVFLGVGGTIVNKILPNTSVNGTARTLRFQVSTAVTNEGFQFFNSSASTSILFAQQNGNVAIGNFTTPTALLHVSNTFSTSSGISNVVAITPTISQTSTAGYTTLFVNTTESTVGSGTKLFADFQLGGSSLFSINNTASINTANPVGNPGNATATLAGLGAGNLSNGAYRYKVTFFNANGETAGNSNTSNTATVVDFTTNGQINLTAISTSTNSSVTGRYIYRTQAGGATWTLLTTINDNTTTTFTDNIADSTIVNNRVSGTTNNTGGAMYKLGTKFFGVDSNGKIVLGNSNLQYPFVLNVISTDTSTATFINSATPSSSSGSGMNGAVLGTPSASDQRLGFLAFGGYNNLTTITNATAIIGFSAGAWTPGVDSSSYLTFGTTPVGSNGRSERMRIFSTGDISIGTTTDFARLAILSTTEQLRLNYDASNYFSHTVNSTGSVTFALTGTTPLFTFSQGIINSTLTASSLVLTNGSKQLVSGTAALQVAAGIPTIVASTFEKAETAVDANVLTYTTNVSTDEYLNVMISTDVSALTGTSLTSKVTWQDSNNATQTSSVVLTGVSDGTVNVPINALKNTSVVVSTTGVALVSVAYNISSFITRLK